MSSRPTKLFKLFLLLAGLLVSIPTATAGWETVRHKGRDYVTVRSIKKFYNFRSMRVSGRTITLENAAVTMKLTSGGQEVFMNNIKFVFSFPIVPYQGRYLVSRIDLSKLVDPVLRPSYIKGIGGFKTVILDPGHGGTDSGAVNHLGLEKNYNLSLARLLQKDLKDRGFEVILTRNADRTLSLSDRVQFANRFKKAIFISLHFNSGGRGQAQGIETFTLSPAGVAHYGRGIREDDFQVRKGNYQDSANIALATAVHSTCLLKTKRNDRGIRRARFSVLTGIKHPAILLEGGFMSNRTEAQYINNARYRQTLSTAIADAVVKFKVATAHTTVQPRR